MVSGNLDFALHRGGGQLEAVAGVDAHLHRAAAVAACLLALLEARACIARNVQFLASVLGRRALSGVDALRHAGLGSVRRAHRLGFAVLRLRSFAFGPLTIARLVLPGRLLGRAHPRLFLGLLARFLLEALALQAIGIAPLGLLALGLQPHGVFRLPLAIDFLLALPLLFLEHRAIEVGLLCTHFDRDGARPALHGSDLDLLLCLALQRDLAGCRRILLPAVGAAQVGQEFHLGLVADDVIGARYLDSSLVELGD